MWITFQDYTKDVEQVLFLRHDHQYGIFLLYKSGYHLVTNRVKIIIFTIGGWRFL